MEKMKKVFKFLGFFALALVIMAFLSPSEKEKQDELKKEISKIENEVLKIPALNIEDNFVAYSQLYKYYPKNENYKNKYLKYKKLEEHESLCRIMSRKYDQKNLLKKDSYNEKSKILKWESFKDFFIVSSFTGNNVLDNKINFISKHKCTISNNQVFFKKVYTKVGI